MVFLAVALFMLVGIGLMLFVARREDSVFYCAQEQIVEYYECDLRVDPEKMVIYTRRFEKSLKIIKKCYNEDLNKFDQEYNHNVTYAYAKSYH